MNIRLLPIAIPAVLLLSICRLSAMEEPEPGSGPGIKITLPRGIAEKPPISSMQFAVEVGRGRITLDQVFEVWGPTWYQTMADVKRGRIPARECDPHLQEEWRRALETVIREEIYYQEAMRAYDQDLARMIDRVYEARQGSRGSSPSRIQVEREVRASQSRQLKRAVNNMIEHYLRVTGGIERLKRVLAARGLTWEEWRRRITKKGLAHRHLRMRISPLVSRMISPADIRDYYHKHEQDFIKPGKVIFRHILFSYEKRGGDEGARLAARNVYDAISAGDISFADAARKHSDDESSRERGGLEDEISPDPEREEWLANIREAVRGEKPGVLGPILVSGRGCHLAVLVRSYPGTPIPFRQAQRRVKDRIYSARWDAAADKYYRELREQVRVRILVPQFPHELSWAAITARERKSPPLIRLGPVAIPEVTSAKNRDESQKPIAPEK